MTTQNQPDPPVITARVPVEIDLVGTSAEQLAKINLVVTRAVQDKFPGAKVKVTMYAHDLEWAVNQVRTELNAYGFMLPD